MRLRVSLLVFVFSAGLAAAGPVEDAIVSQLQEQGYSAVNVRKTMLGRIRIIAANENRVREIIVNPNSGEILRDYSTRRTRLINPMLERLENVPGGSNADERNSSSVASGTAGSGYVPDPNNDENQTAQTTAKPTPQTTTQASDQTANSETQTTTTKVESVSTSAAIVSSDTAVKSSVEESKSSPTDTSSDSTDD